MKKRTFVHLTALVAALAFIPAVALAANDSDFTQTINNGTFSTDILDASRVAVANPSVPMGVEDFSFDCQSSTGTFGTNTERVYALDGVSGNGTWNLNVAAASPTAVWTDGGNTFDFNDSNGSGCTDGGDADSVAGQMTITPGTITADCTGCNTTGISAGSPASFVQGTTDSVTLMSSSGAQEIWRGWIGSSVSQTIPAKQVGGNYSVNLVLTAVDT